MGLASPIWTNENVYARYKTKLLVLKTREVS